MDLKAVTRESMDIRAAYRALEVKLHGEPWSIEEDALAFLTDAALVGRLTMDREGRWPSSGAERLPVKIGECVWWLAVLAERMGLDFESCVTGFLTERASAFGNVSSPAAE